MSLLRFLISCVCPLLGFLIPVFFNFIFQVSAKIGTKSGNIYNVMNIFFLKNELKPQGMKIKAPNT